MKRLTVSVQSTVNWIECLVASIGGIDWWHRLVALLKLHGT